MRKLLAVCVVVFSCIGHSVGADPAVRLKVSPKVTFGPATIRFTVTIEPNANNRKACLAYDGPEAGLSCWQVDGDTHPRTQWFDRRIGGDGDYFATLTLISVVCKDSGECDVRHTTDTTTFVLQERGVPIVR